MQLDDAILQFKDSNILLLQGPVGPFFYHLAQKLKKNNNQIFKLNFNGGDLLFFPFGAQSYRGNLTDFKRFIKNFYLTNKIQKVLMFNDCRPLHKVAIEVAKSLKIPCFIFEEGYIRPNFITLEYEGVNANSTLPKDPQFFLNYRSLPQSKEYAIKHSFRNMAWFSFLYWFAAFWCGFYFNNKLHHRSLSGMEMFPWFLSLFRKQVYKFSEKEDIDFILDSKKQYFALILQVHNDTQIKNHFDGRRIENFIKNSIRSFAQYAKPQHFLVIKHHPMDRGYKNYKIFIKRQARKFNVSQRIIYLHDIHLPQFLHNALGCIVINSTTGLSSILHKCPTKVCGSAFYDIEGLTFQGNLNQFWSNAKKFKTNQQLFTHFRNYLIDHNQINGSFYGSLSSKIPPPALKINNPKNKLSS
ncbi:capsule polysaccharide modification protein KpsS [Helicobacter rodentium]|uniref:capsule polysaccharide modification protein KpsS n=1 Tax=Helicobacter rodentium TaxID=59617 RepID=UPI0025AEDF86|nr:capsular biosynthesis protein [Helicobacter rodentium]